MNRSSLDGRSRNNWRSTSSQAPKVQDNLERWKAASPPKVSPWRNVQSPPLGNGKTKVPSREIRQPQHANLAVPMQTHRSNTRASSPDRAASQSSPEPPTTDCSTSTTSTDLRKAFVAAAPSAGKNLWMHPFGADIHAHAQSTVFKLHRNVVVPQSGWFHDNVPPPNKDGTPVDVDLPFEPEAIGLSLRFMYTHRVEICEYHKGAVLDIIHIPRCVLGYCAAVSLRIKKLAAYFVDVVESSAAGIGEAFDACFVVGMMDPSHEGAFAIHLLNALGAAYGDHLETNHAQDVMKPMRLALAQVLDALLPSMLRQPLFPRLLAMENWQRHASAIAADQVEFRRRTRKRHSGEGAVAAMLERLSIKPTERNNSAGSRNSEVGAEKPPAPSSAWRTQKPAS